MTSYDMIFIFMFGLLISCIIGFNTISLIDKKISNIAINLPELNVPQPNIVLKIDRDEKNRFIIKSVNNESDIKFIENFSSESKSSTSKVACGMKDFRRIPNTCKSMDNFYKKNFDYPIPIDFNGRLYPHNYSNYQNVAKVTSSQHDSNMPKDNSPQGANSDLE